jgi:hypothetical protein
MKGLCRNRGTHIFNVIGWLTRVSFGFRISGLRRLEAFQHRNPCPCTDALFQGLYIWTHQPRAHFSCITYLIIQDLFGDAKRGLNKIEILKNGTSAVSRTSGPSRLGSRTVQSVTIPRQRLPSIRHAQELFNKLRRWQSTRPGLPRQ